MTVYPTVIGACAINAIIGGICLFMLLRRNGRDWLAYMACAHFSYAVLYFSFIPYPVGPALDAYLKSAGVILPVSIGSAGTTCIVVGALRLYGCKVGLRSSAIAVGATGFVVALVGLIHQPFTAFAAGLAVVAICCVCVGAYMCLGPTAFYRLVGVSYLLRSAFVLSAMILTAQNGSGALLDTLAILNMICISMTGFGVVLIELDDARRRVAEADQAKTMFIANMSHELRTPLNAVIGFSEIVQSGVVPVTVADCRTYAGHVLDSGRHLLSIINQLLDMATIEARREKLQYESLRVSDLITQCVTMLRGEAERYGVTIELELEESATDILSDPRAVRQIVTSLISNALKFSRAGGRVFVSCKRDGQNGDCRVTVADQGVGMTDAQVANAFEPFWQGEDTYARNRGGLGLGLAIVKRLVTALDAAIKVDSHPGLGTTFTVVFPARATKLATA